jgi:hypothetical protein
MSGRIVKSYNFTNKGVNATFTIEYPNLSDFAVRLDNLLKHILETSAKEINLEASKNTPWTPVKDSYKYETQVNTGSYVRVNLYNSDPLFHLIEFPAAAHWPNLTRIKLWAAARGISPFYVAVAIAAKGTKGKYIMTDAFVSHLPSVEFNLQQGVNDLLLRL